ncbi:MAG TPA: NAD(+) synthase [Atribacter sp.]|jgi:NAD+ synthase|uniref:NH(3)-dependent NAD(+) synthetase n=1 Tax=Candidatus Atribacter allofermentans TaxID=1852833 RepID=A0A1V5SWP2_9BACT|nr:NAD(+) synthase [Atribacter sp.]OQA58939.1 MAG: NH(3)-dependent NAD(+) synthetase [Candidatus Atribacteria bacterium ADurb.Bin276]HQK82621.1 NAD(+) synthase [Atribacter sp.]
MKDWNQERDRIVDWLRERVQKAKAKGVVLGLSGGIDSSVAGALAKIAFPENTLGLMLPCHSLPLDQQDAELIAGKFAISYQIFSLDFIYDSYLALLGESYSKPLPLPLANIIPRIRMTVLYYFAQKENYLVCGATNKSELTVGYYTKYGDGGVDLMPLAHLTKTEVWQFAKFLEIPASIIEKAPSAGLWEDQTDEKEMGICYAVLDAFIQNGLGNQQDIAKIQKMIKRTEHKRQLPPRLERHS